MSEGTTGTHRGPTFEQRIVRIRRSGSFFRPLVIAIPISVAIGIQNSDGVPGWWSIVAVVVALILLLRGVWVTRTHVVIMNLWGPRIVRRSRIRGVGIEKSDVWLANSPGYTRPMLVLALEGRTSPVGGEGGFVPVREAQAALDELRWRLGAHLVDPIVTVPESGTAQRRGLRVLPADLPLPSGLTPVENPAVLLPYRYENPAARVSTQGVVANELVYLGDYYKMPVTQTEAPGEAWVKSDELLDSSRIPRLPALLPLVLRHRDMALAVTRTLLPGRLDGAGPLGAEDLFDLEPRAIEVDRALAGTGLALALVPEGWELAQREHPAAEDPENLREPEPILLEALHRELADEWARSLAADPRAVFRSDRDEFSQLAVEARGLVAAAHLMRNQSRYLALVSSETVLRRQDTGDAWVLERLTASGFAANALWDYARAREPRRERVGE
ncbi:hypothetical protein M2390_000184 [Mycetocola sp. BIGb0189]|uniref:hypothetical protein n=1 Tax=Mycetocola sp. BIGb0189 TaxID=2940604 RepID=UPI002168CB6D|nr:hypothetical protein [Mycetocola sp. BIGb0189]MCS4275026.1 hypothetical protein [Mycetocola sp. BIGb0189]